jgi:peptidoglycan/LPS O-acetylase OafA/YrhL
MVISGFSMCCGYYDKIMNNTVDFKQFYSKRYAKILPYFAFLCFLDLIISPSKESLYEVFANLTLCFGLLPDAQISVIGVGWFLGVVFAFYLMFPFFCYLLSNKVKAWFSFGVAFIFNILCQVYFNATRSNIVYSAVFFIVGGLIFLYKEQLTEISKNHKWIVLLLCLSSTVGYYVIGGYVPVMIIMFSLFLIYALNGEIGGVLDNKFTNFVSGISMEIYLCHMVIFRALEKLHLVHLFESSVLSYIFMSIATIVGAIVFAVVTKKGLKLLLELINKNISNPSLFA